MDVLDFGLAPLHEFMPDRAFQEACRRARRMTFNDGDALHARGDAPPRLGIIATGVLRVGRYQPGGAFNLVAMLGVGGHFGDVALQRTSYTHDVYSVGRSEIDVIGKAALKDLLDNHSDFAVGLLRCSLARFNVALELYDDARTLGITARLAKVIYVHTGRGELANGVACLQRDLSELLGVSQVSIGNALKELENANLVETGYRRVTVPDKARLKAWLRKSGAV